MKKNVWASFVVILLCHSSCTHHGKAQTRLSHDDSLKVMNDRAYQIKLSELQKVREDFIGPYVGEMGASVTLGDKFRTYLMDDTTTVITGRIEKLESKLEHAQKDSTTEYGAILTRFKLLKTQHKYMTGTYDDQGHLLRFTTEVTFDDKREEEKNFYFKNGELVYFRERHTFTQEEQDFATDDSYFLVNGKVAFAYRDLGAAQVRKDKMDYMASIKRYHLNGDLTSHVAVEFENFKKDYDILLICPLEPLIYTLEQHVQ